MPCDGKKHGSFPFFSFFSFSLLAFAGRSCLFFFCIDFLISTRSSIHLMCENAWGQRYGNMAVPSKSLAYPDQFLDISAQLVEIFGPRAMHGHGQRGMSPRNNHGCRHARLAVSFEKKTDSTGRGLRLWARGPVPGCLHAVSFVDFLKCFVMMLDSVIIYYILIKLKIQY